MQNNSTTIIQQGNETIVPKEIKNLFAGGLAGMLAKTVVAPIDRIKILYQVTAIQAGGIIRRDCVKSQLLSQQLAGVYSRSRIAV